jgi:hypothetical protein
LEDEPKSRKAASFFLLLVIPARQMALRWTKHRALTEVPSPLLLEHARVRVLDRSIQKALA